MTLSQRIVVVGAALCALSAYGEVEESKTIPIESVTAIPRRTGGGLGTEFYAPSENEKSFFERLTKDEITTGGLAGDYDISEKDNTYVGWFGIVREVTEEKKENRTRLLVEHKYFDGMTDTHIQSLSFNGSGDFEAVLPGIEYDLPLLTLVKVYGRASVPNEKHPPRIQAEFVRNWRWRTFTFMFASGKQRGSQRWRKLNKVALDDIYDPYPDKRYYEMRLGER